MSLVRLDQEGPLAVITFDNPPRGYMNGAQVAELTPIIDRLATDDTVRAVVFTGGVPGVFVRHYDVGEILQMADAVKQSGLDDADLMESAKTGNPVSQLFDKVDVLPVPTIAAINGFTQGGGFEFALCCDIRIAEEGGYRIGLPEVNVGIFPGAGGTQRLPRVVGEARALEMILRGRTVGPEEAARLGLVHECVPKDALGRAKEIALEIAKLPRRAVADAKRLVKSATITPLSEGQTMERGMFSQIIKNDPDAIAAMQHFLDEGEDINRTPPAA